GQSAERGAPSLFAAPPEARCLAFAGLDRDRGLAGVAGERVAGWVAGAAVADLGQQLGGGDEAVLEQRQEDGAVGVGADRGLDLPLERPDLVNEGLERRDQAEHELPARFELRLAAPPFGRATQLGEQLSGLLAPRVVLAGKERLQPLLAQPLRVGGARVALQKRERDVAVQIG